MMHAIGRRFTRRLPLAALAAALTLVATEAQPQYFGRNKVQYHQFKFRVMKTRHFDIYYYPEEQAAVEQAARLAERWYTRLSRALGHQFAHRQPIVLYAAHTHFEQTNVLPGFIGEGTGGVTELFKRRIVLPMAGPLAETDHVLGHELVHAFQFDITGSGAPGPVTAGNIPGALHMPLWFIEGMAEYLSIGPVDPHTSMWMRDALQRDKKPPEISDLGKPEYFPYRWGQALWAYLGGRFGDAIVGDALKAATRGGDAVKVIESLAGVPIKQLSEDWHKALREAYGPILDDKQRPAQIGAALITDRNGGRLNVGPAVSPDGQRLAFLSEKDLFSIDLFLANAKTGEIRRKIVETAADPHYESLQFINSAGAWDAAGQSFAFAAVREGKAILSIQAVDGGKDREIKLRDVDEAFDPSWSPDGRALVFSGMKGGFLDLYVYDLGGGRLRRLTEDPYADLQPAWSPDGRTIAFVTDRFSTQLDTLRAGNYRLAAMDSDGTNVRELPGFEEVKNIDPQWSGDGTSLFFLSDRNGITNVYRLELATRQISKVTDISTGVSGITALSPSLTVARDRVIYSAYEESQYRIYAIESAERMAGQPLGDPSERMRAATLPPRERSESVVSWFGQPGVGAPARPVETEEYKPKLTLDYVGQPTLTVGAGARGAFVGGGVAFLFSDVLGEHTLGVMAQVNGSLRDFGGLVAYENRQHRWAWGAGLEQIPYLTGAFRAGTTDVDGQRVFAEQVELFRETARAASGYVAYPFSRSQRIEFGAAARNISFTHERHTQYFSLAGNFLGDEHKDLAAPAGITYGEATAALVYDSAVFGATSPILGRRYRFEANPTFGQVQFTGLLADFRQYLMPIRPITLAGRLLHYGRYGGGAEDERIRPLFIGYPNLVRGYDVNSFEARECGNDPSRCPVFDQLLGSRIAVANAELRVPLFSIFRARRNLYGPVPIELIGFYDVGVAWTRAERAAFLNGGDGRRPVESVGYGARVNVFGFAVIEIDRVRPLDRPGRNWVWVFNLSPGF